MYYFRVGVIVILEKVPDMPASIVPEIWHVLQREAEVVQLVAAEEAVVVDHVTDDERIPMVIDTPEDRPILLIGEKKCIPWPIGKLNR